MGLKTPIRVTVANDITATSSKDVIFTVLTSPDVASANYWGHMPETVEGPDGLRYQRPHLQAEAPSGVNYITVNGENGRRRPAYRRIRQASLRATLSICR